MRKKLREILREVDEAAIAEAAEFIRQITVMPGSAPFVDGYEASVGVATWKTEGGFGFSLRCIGVRSNHINWGNMPVFVCSADENSQVLAVQHIDEFGRVMFEDLRCDKCILRASDTWGEGSLPAPGNSKIYNAERGNVRVTIVRRSKMGYEYSAESNDQAEQNSEVLVAILPAEQEREHIISKKLIVGQPISLFEDIQEQIAAYGAYDRLVFCVLPRAGQLGKD